MPKRSSENQTNFQLDLDRFETLTLRPVQGKGGQLEARQGSPTRRPGGGLQSEKFSRETILRLIEWIKSSD